MKMLITPEWLKKKIEDEPECSCEAGIPISMEEYKAKKEHDKLKEFRKKVVEEVRMYHTPLK